jgi:hypothetical protein
MTDDSETGEPEERTGGNANVMLEQMLVRKHYLNDLELRPFVPHPELAQSLWLPRP